VKNLSNNNLNGSLPEFLTKLPHLTVFDRNLSHNSLNGPVPGFLAKLTSLRVLNLTGNNLTGSHADELVRRLEDSSLIISCDGNPDLRFHEKKKNKFIVPLVVSAAAIVFTLLIALAIWLRHKRRKEQDRNAITLRATDISPIALLSDNVMGAMWNYSSGSTAGTFYRLWAVKEGSKKTK
ncbi:hypothetical protein Ddye_022690, partial [Dipteronia dyeriana]